MMRHRPFASTVFAMVAISVLAGPAYGQRTLVVDPNGGPGTFADLPPAVAAALDGDNIVVRAGMYSGAVVGKAVRILCDTGTSVNAGQRLRVQGLAASQTFVLHGLTAGSVALESCAGRVHLESLSLMSRLSVRNCSQVTATQVVATGAYAVSGLDAVGSTLLLTDCRFWGDAGSPGTTPGAPAARLYGCQVTATGCWFRGGAGGSGPLISAPSGEGIDATDSTLVIAGDSTLVLAGRVCCWPGAGGAPAVRLQRSLLTYDPSVRLLPSGARPPVAIVGKSVARARTVAALRAAGAPPRGTLFADVQTPVGFGAVLLMSLPAFEQPSPFGPLWLDLPTMFVVGVQLVGASQHAQFPVAIPRVRKGTPVTLQAAVGLGVIGELSTPATVVLR